MKKIVPLFIIGSVFLFDHLDFKNLTYPNIPLIKNIGSLVQNSDMSIITSVRKNEKNGLKDLRKIIDYSRNEEMWCYIPKKRSG